MVALSMIMMNEFGYGSSQRLLAEENHPVETFAFYRKNKPFDVSVHVRRTVRQANDSSSGVVDEPSKLRGELLVAAEDEESLLDTVAAPEPIATDGLTAGGRGESDPLEI